MWKNAKKKSWKGGGGAITAPCGQDTTPYGSKPLVWKIIVYSNYCWGKKENKTNISPFSATYTYINLTFVSFFFLFFLHLSLSSWPFDEPISNIFSSSGALMKQYQSFTPTPPYFHPFTPTSLILNLFPGLLLLTSLSLGTEACWKVRRFPPISIPG